MSKNIDSFVSGQIGGMCGVIAGQPFDTLKILMQTTKSKKIKIARTISGIVRQTPLRPSWRHRELITLTSNTARYKSISSAALDVYQREGLLGFYRGIAYPLLATGCQKGLAFGVSSFALDWLQQRREQHTESKSEQHTRPHLFDLTRAGIVAGISNTILCTPVDQLKIAQQIRLPTPLSFAATATELVSNFNHRIIPSLFGAWKVTLLRECIGYGFYFSFYEILSRGILKVTNTNETKPWMHFIAGGLTGSSMWALYFPIDAIKSRQQASISRFRGSTKSQSIPSGTDLLIRIWKKRPSSFYRGLTPALLRAFPAHGSIFVGYEATMKSLQWIRNRE